MTGKSVILIERLKNIIAEMAHSSDSFQLIKNSEYIAQQFSQGCTYLDNLFSEATGITIEQFSIRHKIDRAKKLLIYGEFSLTEISYMLNFTSVAHLYAQFKKTTGLTPTFFINVKNKRNKLFNDG